MQASLAWWAVVSPFTPYGPTIALVFVLLVAAAKAAAEDRKRHAEDRRTNNSVAHVVQADGASWTSLGGSWSRQAHCVSCGLNARLFVARCPPVQMADHHPSLSLEMRHIPMQVLECADIIGCVHNL